MVTNTLVKITRYVSLLGCGMLAGVAVTVLVLELALRRLNGQEYARVRQAEFAFFTPFIGAVFLPTLVAVAMLVIHARKTHSITLRPAVIALALLLLALLLSLAVNGPINVTAELECAGSPADWARIRDRWQIAHAVRTLAIVLALGYLSAAILTARSPACPTAARSRPLNPARQAREHAWQHDTACAGQIPQETMLVRGKSLRTTCPNISSPRSNMRRTSRSG
jgi:uncharacterized membrane protein